MSGANCRKVTGYARVKKTPQCPCLKEGGEKESLICAKREQPWKPKPQDSKREEDTEGMLW